MGRKAIGDRPMTVAERQARSRALRVAEVVGELHQVSRELARLRREVLAGQDRADVAECIGLLSVRVVDVATLVGRGES